MRDITETVKFIKLFGCLKFCKGDLISESWFLSKENIARQAEIDSIYFFPEEPQSPYKKMKKMRDITKTVRFISLFSCLKFFNSSLTWGLNFMSFSVKVDPSDLPRKHHSSGWHWFNLIFPRGAPKPVQKDEKHARYYWNCKVYKLVQLFEVL